MSIDIEALRKLAKAATPGRWHLLHENSPNDCDCAQVWCDWAVAYCDTQDDGEGFTRPQQMANAAHIAAFNPVTALALLDALDSAQARIAELEAALRPFAVYSLHIDDYDDACPLILDSTCTWPDTLKLGDCRAARRALGDGHG